MTFISPTVLTLGPLHFEWDPKLFVIWVFRGDQKLAAILAISAEDWRWFKRDVLATGQWS